MNLTPAAIVVVVFAAVLGIVGQWNAAIGALPWWRLVVIALVAGLALEMLVVRASRITARLAGTQRIYLGRHENLALEFENSGARGLSVQFAPALPDAVRGPVAATVLEIAPGAKARWSARVRPLALGRHRWGPLPIRIKGPLGLGWWSQKLPLAAELKVLPDTLGPRAAAAAGSVRGGANPESALGGALELHHLREYRPGDPLRSIDWKASARAAKLISRIFNEDQHLEVMIMLDVGRTSRTQFDGMNQLGHYVNLAARFAEYCVASDDQVGIVAFADAPVATVRPGRGVESVKRIRRALAGLAPRAVEADVLRAALHMRHVLRHRCLVVVLTDLYERSATSQLVQMARLLLPKHFPMIVGLLSEDVAGLASRQAREWLDPYESLAAREHERQIRANVARLVQLGARALTARPAELDRKVLGQYDLLRAQRRI